MKITFIRHGKTYGNSLNRYIGRTDEALSEEGIAALKNKKYDISHDIIISSPMKRCLQTTEIIFGREPDIIEYDLRECDFGIFEGKNYMELSDEPFYQKWVDSNCELPIPDGESKKDFSERSVKAFLKIFENNINKDMTFVVHGGTIMAILCAFTENATNFYDFQVKNGEGYITEFVDGKFTSIKKID